MEIKRVRKPSEPPKFRWTDAKLDEFDKLYRGGLGPARIAGTIGVDLHAVQERIKKINNISIHYPKVETKLKPRKIRFDKGLKKLKPRVKRVKKGDHAQIQR